MGNYLQRPITAKVSENGECKQLRFGLSSMQGWRSSMEDSHIASLRPFAGGIAGSMNFDNLHLFGVFDGHGGSQVSRFVSKHMLEELTNIPAFSECRYDEALRATFLKLDQMLMKEEHQSELETFRHPPRQLAPVLEQLSDEVEKYDLSKEDTLCEQFQKGTSKTNITGESDTGASDTGTDNTSTTTVAGSNISDLLIDAPTPTESSYGPDGNTSSFGETNRTTSTSSTNVGSGNNSGASTPQASERSDTSAPITQVMSEPVAATTNTGTSTGTPHSSLKTRLKSFGSASSDSIASSGTGASGDTPMSRKERKHNGRSQRRGVATNAPVVVSSNGGGNKAAGGGDPPSPASGGGIFGSLRNALMKVVDVGRSQIWSPSNRTQAPIVSLAASAGCTALVVLIDNNRLVIANAGDSRCVLCRGSTAIDLSLDHKPHLPSERSRIYSAGGFLQMGRVNGNLNLSRAIGDLVYKQDPNLPQEKQIVISLPDVRIVPIQDDDQFIVIGCDGIWERDNSSRLVIDFVRNRIDSARCLSDIVEALFDELLSPNPGVIEIGCDNMTTCIVDLKPHTRRGPILEPTTAVPVDPKSYTGGSPTPAVHKTDLFFDVADTGGVYSTTPDTPATTAAATSAAATTTAATSAAATTTAAATSAAATTAAATTTAAAVPVTAAVSEGNVKDEHNGSNSLLVAGGTNGDAQQLITFYSLNNESCPPTDSILQGGVLSVPSNTNGTDNTVAVITPSTLTSKGDEEQKQVQDSTFVLVPVPVAVQNVSNNGSSSDELVCTGAAPPLEKAEIVNNGGIGNGITTGMRVAGGRDTDDSTTGTAGTTTDGTTTDGTTTDGTTDGTTTDGSTTDGTITDGTGSTVSKDTDTRSTTASSPAINDNGTTALRTHLTYNDAVPATTSETKSNETGNSVDSAEHGKPPATGA